MVVAMAARGALRCYWSALVLGPQGPLDGRMLHLHGRNDGVLVGLCCQVIAYQLATDEIAPRYRPQAQSLFVPRRQSRGFFCHLPRRSDRSDGRPHGGQAPPVTVLCPAATAARWAQPVSARSCGHWRGWTMRRTIDY